MNTQDYHKSITTTVSAEEAFTKISSVTWWTANFTGSAKNLNDVFTMYTDPFCQDTKIVSFKVCSPCLLRQSKVLLEFDNRALDEDAAHCKNEDR